MVYFRRAVKIVSASDSSLLVELGDAISLEVHGRVMALFEALQQARDARIRNIHPAYASVLVDFDPRRTSHAEMKALLKKLAGERRRKRKRAENAVTIPVCYDEELAPDLAEVAKQAKISTEEAIRLHAAATYRVYFLGFSPGFAYMGGLPERLRVARLETPRKLVKAGTVGIAGEQTAVYPVDSPGGWRLIGRTPVRMFDAEATPPARLQPGDVVQFRAIGREEFEGMARGAVMGKRL